MRIGDLAKSTAVSAKMIRHYESIGLTVPGPRTANGYREYGERDVHELRFIRSARDLGFSLDEIRDLLDLWRNKKRRSRDVHALAKRHLAEIESRIERFEAMAATLRKLMADCHDDERPDCPILKGLSAH